MYKMESINIEELHKFSEKIRFYCVIIKVIGKNFEVQNCTRNKNHLAKINKTGF